jgi:mannose-6-phosphate isomerase-like protein (cupin superfamily)
MQKKGTSMEKMNRRDLCVALSAFAALGSLGPLAQARQMAPAGNASGGKKKDAVLSRSETFAYDSLPVTHLPNGGTMRRVISGVLVTGEYIEVHESMLPAGKMPHPPHRHRNSEILFIREGKLEFLNNGRPEPVGPGGVVFTASNVLHGLKNVGATPATYFVIAIGRAEPES